MAAEGYIFATKADSDGIPDFLTVDQDAVWYVRIPNRFHTYTLEETVDGGGELYFKQLRDSSDVPLSLAAGRRAYALSFSDDVDGPRAIRIIKYIQGQAWMSWTLAELQASGNSHANTIKNSPDMILPTSYDGGGLILTSTTDLYHTVTGFNHTTAMQGTTASEVSAASSESF